MARRVKIIPPPLVPRKPPPEKPVEPIKKGEIPKADPAPNVVPQTAPGLGEPIDLLKKQRKDGGELLRMAFLPLGKGQQWKALTRDILAKVFGLDSALIDGVLYSGEQPAYSVYEPESSLEKQRRKTFQASLRMLEICIEEFDLNKDSSKPEVIEKIKTRVAAERQAFMAQSLEEGKKEAEPSKEVPTPPITKAVADEKTPERQKTIIVEEPEEAKEPDVRGEPSEMDMSKEPENPAAPGGQEISAVEADDDEEVKEPEVSEEAPKHDMAKAIEEEEAADGEAVSIVHEPKEEKREAEPVAKKIQPDSNNGKESMKTSQSRKVFIVHGNDEAMKEGVAAFLSKMELEPVILHEQPGHVLTLIEKFENYSDVVFAVIILTGDDYGYAKGKPEESKPRPKQNVVFELGFLIGRFPGQHVCALHEEGLEMPSDYKSAVFIPHDAGGVWKLLIARAMKTANVDVDLNKAI